MEAKVITAKALATELKIDQKKLRRKLRSLAADGKFEHTKAERWEFTPEQAAAVKALLTAKPEKVEAAS